MRQKEMSFSKKIRNPFEISSSSYKKLKRTLGYTTTFHFIRTLNWTGKLDRSEVIRVCVHCAIVEAGTRVLAQAGTVAHYVTDMILLVF